MAPFYSRNELEPREDLKLWLVSNPFGVYGLLVVVTERTSTRLIKEVSANLSKVTYDCFASVCLLQNYLTTPFHD